MKMLFNAANWYWVVGGSTTQVFSSLAGDYVSAADATYQVWCSGGGVPTRIDTETNLGGVLAGRDVSRPINANVLAGYQVALVAGVNIAVFKVLFNHENRIRALEGKGAITVQQAIAGFAALM